MTSRATITDLAAVLRSAATADWLDDAACRSLPSGVEFVDVNEQQADDVARTYCYRCSAIGPCRELGERLAPHAYGSVYGARWWAPRERP